MATRTTDIKQDVATADGLRYQAKRGGSPFVGMGRAGDSMSCFKCGMHRPRAGGVFKRLLGKSQFVCADCAKPVER